MRKFKLLLASALMLLAWSGVKAQTQEECDAALATINDGSTYRIKTTVDGTAYYVKTDGTLTNVATDAGVFKFIKTNGANNSPFAVGIQINSGVDGGINDINGRFTNSRTTSSASFNEGKLTVTTGNRADWESQVFFLNENGKYAVRSTNSVGGGTDPSWAFVADAFWCLYNGPQIGYKIGAEYIWEIELVNDAETVVKLEEAAKTVNAWPFTIQSTAGLIMDPSKYTTNAKQSNEGTIEGLLDGDYSSYFHSCWSNGPSADHYLQAELPTATQNFRFYFVKRDPVTNNNINNRPTKIIISASNDGKNFKDIKTITADVDGLPKTVPPSNYLSDKIDLGDAYKYVRFTVAETNNNAKNNEHVFFTFSEFYIWPTIPEVEAAASILKKTIYQRDLTAINQTNDALLNSKVKVTYQVKYNDQIVASESTEGLVNTVPQLPSKCIRDFVTYTTDVDVIGAGENIVTYTAKWDGPFKISTDYANAQWQNMAMRGTWYVTSGNKDDDGAYKTVNANALGLGTDAYQWAFIGNPYDGFKVINKAGGEGNSFGWTEDNQGNGGIPTILPDNEGNHLWRIAKSTSNINTATVKAFILNVPGTNLYINQYGGAGGSVKFWDSTGNIGDAGSAFTVFDVPTNYAEFVTSEIAPYFETTAKYFVLKEDVKAGIGYDPAYKTECPFEAYKSMKEKMTEIDNIKNYVLPESGFYNLKNKYYGTYMGIDPSDANMYGNYRVCNLPKQVVMLTKVGDATYNITLMGKNAPVSVAQSQAVTATEKAGTYTVVIPTIGYAAFQADTESQYSCLHCAGGGDIVGWVAASDASIWEVVEPTIVDYTIGEEGYATAYLPCPVNFAETVPYTVPEAKGVWTFDDANDLLAGTGVATLKATKHSKNNVTETDLATAGITTVDGPSDGNGALNIPVGASLLMAANTGATSIGTYTIMYDVCVEDGSTYVPLLQNSLTDGKDGSLFINKNKVGLGGGIDYHGNIENNKWYRIVFVVEPTKASLYADGNHLASYDKNFNNPSGSYLKHWLLTTGALFFADEDGEEKAIKTSEIRFWDQALTAEQVAILSTVGTNDTEKPAASGVKAYSGKVNGSYLTLNEIQGIVPQKTPVILKGNPGTYSFLIPKNILGLPHIENDLKGTLEPIDATGKYVLAQPENEKIGFYLAKDGKIAATKAYLELPTTEVKAYYFIGDGATAIENIEAKNNTNDVIYNIAGQRINKLQKGINIVNGKKILK